MQLGMVGLGKMGANMTTRLVQGGHEVVGFDRSPDAVQGAVGHGARGASALEDLVRQLRAPRAVWVMCPAGDATESNVRALAELRSKGDTIIDGGNSNYKESIRRSAMVAEQGLSFIDVGTSGGIWGLTEGYSLMVGGPNEAVDRLRPIFETLAPAKDQGWGHVGPAGAGHFKKMVHNGIEYGMMQAYAEGFSILKHKKEFELDLAQIAELWRTGSVVRSWLLDLTARALHDDQDLSSIAPYVSDSGEGRWTIAAAIDEGVPVPVLSAALFERFSSRDEGEFAGKVMSAMRAQFGGHKEKPHG